MQFRSTDVSKHYEPALLQSAYGIEINESVSKHQSLMCELTMYVNEMMTLWS